MRIEDIKVGKTYIGADSSERKVVKIEGFGRGALVNGTTHLHLFALWAQKEK